MVILDTNVVSELMRPTPEPVVLRWLRSQIAGELHITAITMGEILYGVQMIPVAKRRAEVLWGAEKMFEAVFAGQILEFDERAARVFSQTTADRRRASKPISDLNAQIAAIARSHGAALATRDVDDFEGCGLQLINPWKA